MINLCREVREAKNLTQEAFGKRLNVTRQTIIRWEKNPETIPVKSLTRIVSLDTEDAI